MIQIFPKFTFFLEQQQQQNGKHLTLETFARRQFLVYHTREVHAVMISQWSIFSTYDHLLRCIKAAGFSLWDWWGICRSRSFTTMNHNYQLFFSIFFKSEVVAVFVWYKMVATSVVIAGTEIWWFTISCQYSFFG